MSWTTTAMSRNDPEIYKDIRKRLEHSANNVKTIVQMLNFIIRPQLPKSIIAFTSLFKFLNRTGD